MSLPPIRPTEFVQPHPEWNEKGGDHDEPYRFARRPTADNPFPFSVREYVRLWLLRFRFQRPDPMDTLDERPEDLPETPPTPAD